MSKDNEKPAPQSPTTPRSVNSPSAQQPVATPSATKGSRISRRAFLVGAMGASILLTAASLAQSPSILGPLIPPNEDTVAVASAKTLESQYEAALASNNPTTNVYVPSVYSDFFYFPYDITVSPYYKDILVRIPDSVSPTSQSKILTVPKTQPFMSGTQYDAKFVAYNTTCVHLRCLVNPGYDSASGEFRLQCPCHGSQYRMSDGVPVAGPAFDLGLNPLPQITIDVDSSGNIIAKNGLNGINGTPGIGRTS